MTLEDIRKTAEQKMARSIESFKGELQKIRTGRAHPGISTRCMSTTTARSCPSARWPT